MLAAYWRGEITLRKLRVLIEYLPADSPVYWHHHGGKPWTIELDLLWKVLWAAATEASKGIEKGRNIFEKMPRYPWSDPPGTQRIGGWGDRDGNEVLDYLSNL